MADKSTKGGSKAEMDQDKQRKNVTEDNEGAVDQTYTEEFYQQIDRPEKQTGQNEEDSSQSEEQPLAEEDKERMYSVEEDQTTGNQ